MSVPILITTHSDSVHLLHLSADNSLTLATSLQLGEQPSFALPHPVIPNLLYVSSWVPNTIYAINVTTGLDGRPAELSIAGQTSSAGEGPTYFVITNDRQSLLIANYRSGSVTRVGLDPQSGMFVQSDRARSVAAVLQLPYDRRSGRRSRRLEERQEGPHAHHILRLPSRQDDAAVEQYMVCELGGDRLYVVQYDNSQGWSIISSTKTEAGYGPRHAVSREVSGQEPLLYVVNELANVVTVHRIHRSAGVTKISEPLFSPVSTLPPSYSQAGYEPQGAYESIACAILLPSPDQLIVTNRNADASVAPKGDSIAVFSVADDGSLTLTDSIVGAGRHLRGINIGKRSDGKDSMLVASREGDGMSIYSRAGESWTAEAERVATDPGIRLPVGINWL